jgi:UrcA family protein
MTKTFKMLLVAACLSTPVSAFAAERDPNSTTVRYHDLDLTQAAGVKALNSRIRTAAAKVCGWESTVGASSCRRQTVAGAQAQVDRAIATAQLRKAEQLASR